MFSRKPNEKKIKLYHGELVKTLDLLETVWLKSDEKGFLTTDFITFADILCAVELEQTSKILKFPQPIYQIQIFNQLTQDSPISILTRVARDCQHGMIV